MADQLKFETSSEVNETEYKVAGGAGSGGGALGFDESLYDYVLSVDNIEQASAPWSQDPAFLPTSITFGLTFIVGVLGNSLVVFALLGDKKARNVTSSFLVSLALADLLFLLICVPYETSVKLAAAWSGGRALCKISGFVEMLSATASILNLTTVSVERYFVIVHPMKSRSWFTMGHTKVIICLVWFTAFLLSSPLLYVMDTKVYLFYSNTSQAVRVTCFEANWPEDGYHHLAFAWYQFTAMFLVPTVVMVFCYAVVIHVLWISTKELARMTHSDRDADEESRQRLTVAHSPNHYEGKSVVIIRSAARDHGADVREARKQVIKMLLTIICIFLICWGPKLILNIMKKHGMSALHQDHDFVISLLTTLLPYIQSATNPIIYGFMSKNFRRSIRLAFRQHCKCDPVNVCVRRNPRPNEFDLETKSVTINGSYATSRYSPTRAARTSMTAVSEF